MNILLTYFILHNKYQKYNPPISYNVTNIFLIKTYSWWRHQMETFSALLAICAGNSPVTGEFPAQRPVTRSFDAFFDLRLNKRLSKQSWGWWFETLSRPLWRHCNVIGPWSKCSQPGLGYNVLCAPILKHSNLPKLAWQLEWCNVYNEMHQIFSKDYK